MAAAPTIAATLGPAGQALIAGIRDDLAAQWLENHAETALRGGPEDGAPLFTMVPQWSTLKRLDSRGDWIKVQYAGDGGTRQPGPGWVRAADTGPVRTPPVWLAAARPTALRPDTPSERLARLGPNVRLEVVGPESTAGTRVHVRTPGDGQTTPPAQGWVDAADLTRVDPPGPGRIPWAFPDELRAQVHILVPYRTQLDGSDYAGANCGPTALGMALAALGVRLEPRLVRTDVLEAQDTAALDDDAGSYIWALAQVAQEHGAQALGLFENDGATLHQWSVDEIKQQVAKGRPVIAQVRYRFLPRRGESTYYADHYIVVTGLLGDNVLYDDPIGGASDNEGPGWDRVMTPSQLERAMNASDGRYAYSAFALAQ